MRISLADYAVALAAHDYSYPYSDDHQVFVNAERERYLLEALSDESPAHKALFTEFEEKWNKQN